MFRPVLLSANTSKNSNHRLQRLTIQSERRILIALLATGAIALPAAAAAIVTRHDVRDEAYERKAADLPSYCRMMAPDGGGALIAPGWVITAAHLAPEFKPRHRFRCGTEVLEMAEIIVHPQYDEAVGRHDLALIRLAKPSRQTPLQLWRRDTEAEHVVNLIGHWQGGNGLTGVSVKAKKTLKGATNTVASADENWLRLVLDSPFSGAVTSLEGVSGSGDSGAPAYVTQGSATYLLGVGSRNSDTNDDGIEQNYGDTDLYVRISSHAAWIDRVLAGRETFLSRAAMRYQHFLPWALGLATLIILAFLRRRARR